MAEKKKTDWEKPGPIKIVGEAAAKKIRAYLKSIPPGAAAQMAGAGERAAQKRYEELKARAAEYAGRQPKPDPLKIAAEKAEKKKPDPLKKVAEKAEKKKTDPLKIARWAAAKGMRAYLKGISPGLEWAKSRLKKAPAAPPPPPADKPPIESELMPTPKTMAEQEAMKVSPTDRESMRMTMGTTQDWRGALGKALGGMRFRGGGLNVQSSYEPEPEQPKWDAMMRMAAEKKLEQFHKEQHTEIKKAREEREKFGVMQLAMAERIANLKTLPTEVEVPRPLTRTEGFWKLITGVDPKRKMELQKRTTRPGVAGYLDAGQDQRQSDLDAFLNRSALQFWE